MNSDNRDLQSFLRHHVSGNDLEAVMIIRKIPVSENEFCFQSVTGHENNGKFGYLICEHSEGHNKWQEFLSSENWNAPTEKIPDHLSPTEKAQWCLDKSK